MINNYREIRGILTEKKRTIFGNYLFYVTDRIKTLKIVVGKGIFEKIDCYSIGKEVTVGYIGSKLINIRPGICDNND